MSKLRDAVCHESPLAALGRGILAGAAGTAAMTAWQAALSRAQDEDASDSEAPQDPWASAPAPAQAAKRILEGVFHRKVSAARIPLLTNATHWAYGTVWGSAYGVMQETLRTRPLPLGLTFGITVWGTSYAVLVPMGIYRAPWRYAPTELAADLSYHLVYGTGTALAYDAVSS